MWIEGIWIDRYETADPPGGPAPADPPKEPDPPKPPDPPATPAPPKTKYLAQLKKEYAADHGDELLEISEETQGLAEYAINAKRKLARSIVVPDKENPDPDELKAFRAAIGLPETIEGYTLDSGEVEIPEALTGAIRKMAHERSLSTTQAQGVYSLIAEQVKTGVATREAADKDAKDNFDARLTEQFGGDAVKGAAAKNLYLAALHRMAGLVEKDEGFSQRLIDSGLVHDVSFAHALALTEQHMGDHTFIEGGGSGIKPGQKKKGGKMVHYSAEWMGLHGQ